MVRNGCNRLGETFEGIQVFTTQTRAHRSVRTPERSGRLHRLRVAVAHAAAPRSVGGELGAGSCAARACAPSPPAQERVGASAASSSRSMSSRTAAFTLDAAPRTLSSSPKRTTDARYGHAAKSACADDSRERSYHADHHSPPLVVLHRGTARVRPGGVLLPSLHTNLDSPGSHHKRTRVPGAASRVGLPSASTFSIMDSS